MHLLKLILVIWFWFGVLTILGFLWLGRKGVQALDKPGKEPSFEKHPKPSAVVRSNAA
jgi:hypothetical protein